MESGTDVVMIAAVIAGPILAVLATRYVDQLVEKRRRRLDVFRSLMETRGLRLDPSHVSALNLVDIEFYHDKKVRETYRRYIEHLSSPMPPVEEQPRFFDQRSNLFLDLLADMGSAVRMRFDKNDLQRLSYVPVAWDNDEAVRRKNMLLINQLLAGERPLPVTNFLSSTSPYPPPPGNSSSASQD